MYLDNLPNRKVSELKQEFYRLRNVDKFYWTYEYMEVYSELSLEALNLVINKYSYVVLNHHILYYNDCNDGLCGIRP